MSLNKLYELGIPTCLFCKHNLTHNKLNHNLFYNVSKEGLIVTLILNVDDVLFIIDNTTKKEL
jgi:hypothetical protein